MKKNGNKEAFVLPIEAKKQKELTDKVIEALGKDYCTIIRNTIYREDPGNSKVYASFWWMPMQKLLDACAKHFSRRFNVSYEEAYHNIVIGLNEVDINGFAPEEPHFHVSHIVGMITKGAGMAELKENEKMVYKKVKAGDTVVIPANAYHYFQGDPGIVYMALEIGYKAIDYQKHHHH